MVMVFDCYAVILCPEGQNHINFREEFSMYPVDATKERFESVEILGIPGLFTTSRVNRNTVPKGMYAYDLQTSEDDWSQPCMVGRHIMVEHMGTVLTASPIALSSGGYCDLHPGDFATGKAGYLTVSEFEVAYLAV
jgi:hypothetical protein